MKKLCCLVNPYVKCKECDKALLCYECYTAKASAMIPGASFDPDFCSHICEFIYRKREEVRKPR